LAIVIFEEEFDEVFEAFCFYLVVAGRSYELGKLRGLELIYFFGREAIFVFEVFNSFFDVFPVCVLCEYCTDYDFEFRIAGPPVLRAEMLVEELVDLV